MTPERRDACLPITAGLALFMLLSSPASAVTTSWTNAAGGNWNTASNWDMGVPGLTDDAVINLSGTYTVTLDVSPSVASLALGGIGGTKTLSGTSRTLTLAGPSTVGSGGLLTLTSSTLNGAGSLENSGTVRLTSSTASVPIDNAGILDVRGATALSAVLTTAAGSTLNVTGVTGTATVVNVADGFTNNGTLNLTSIGGAFAATFNVTTGTLINAAGSSIQALGGTGGARTLNAQVDNQGTMYLGTALTINKTSADHASSGTIDVATGNLTLTQSGTTPSFTNSGAITIGSGRILAVGNGAFIYDGGSIPTDGDWNFTTVATTLNADFTIPAGLDLNYSGGSISGTGNLLSNSSLAGFTGATINVGLALNSSIEFGVGTTNINGALTTGGGVTLTLTGGNGDGLDAIVNVANGFENNGTIVLTATGQFGGAFLNVTSGTLVNKPGATIWSTGTAPVDGERAVNAQILNQGAVDVGIARLTIDKNSADHVNAGTINVTGDDLAIGQPGTTPSFTNSGGTVNVASGRSFSISSGAYIYDGGAHSVVGTFQLNSVATTLNSDYTIEAASNTNFSGGSISGAARLINNGTLTDFAGVTVNVLYENNATAAILSGATIFNGAVITSVGSSLSLLAQTSSASVTMTVANGFTNNGSIGMTTLAQFADVTLNVTAGTLLNAPTGAITTSLGSGGTRNLNAQIDNQGSITTVSTGLTIAKASADHLNSGTIDVSGGNLIISQSGTTPTLTNTGLVSIGSTRTLQSSAGTFTNAVGGLVKGAGTLQAGNTFTNSGTLSPGLSPGILTVTSNCPFSSSGVLDVEINGFTVGTQYDRLSVSGTATLDGTLNVTIPAGFCTGAGDNFRVVQAGTRVGTFDVINVTAYGNPAFNALYDATGLTLATVSNSQTVTSSAGAGGTIDPAGAVAVGCGGSQTFTIASDPCYHIVDVLVDGNSVGPVASYDFSNVIEAHTISATFAVDTHSITASAGSGGGITPSGPISVDCGTSQMFTIASDPCHEIADVVVDGNSVGSVTTYTFTDIQASHTIEASFNPVSIYTLTASAGSGGAIDPSGAVPTSCGSTQMFTITPDACHQILDVLVDGNSVGAVASYTFTDVQANRTISASFAILPYTLAAGVIGGGILVIAPDQPSYDCGASVEITAQAASGWQFNEWTGDATGNGNPLDVIMDSNKSITAVFVDVAAPEVSLTSPNGGEIWYVGSTHAISWTATDNAGVTAVDLAYSIDGGATYPNVIATGLANSGSFDWVIPSTVTPLARVQVTAYDALAQSGSAASNANFEIQNDPTTVAEILLANGEMLGVYPNPARAGEVHVICRIPGAATADLTIFDITGRKVRTFEFGLSADGLGRPAWDGRDEDGRLLSPGVYLVRFAADSGLRATKRIVLLR